MCDVCSLYFSKLTSLPKESDPYPSNCQLVLILNFETKLVDPYKGDPYKTCVRVLVFRHL